MSLNGNEEQSSTSSSSFAGKKRKNLVELTPSFTNTPNVQLVIETQKPNSNDISDLEAAGQEHEMPPSKRQRSNISETSNENMNESFDDKQPNVEARFLIATKTAGAVIGRAGCNITNLRQTFNATISVPDSAGAPERVMTIVAGIDKVSKIIRQILKFIEVRPQSSNQKTSSGHGNSSNTSSSNNANDEKSDKSTPAEIRMLLHISHAGALIGKRGSRITQLREETQAGLRVFSDCLPQSTERVCTIAGPIDVVASAVKSILEIVSAFPIKGESVPYESRNFDPYTAGQYGGFSDISDIDTGRGSSMSSGRGTLGAGGHVSGHGGMSFRSSSGRFGLQDSFGKKNGQHGGMRDFPGNSYYAENGLYGNSGRLTGNGFGSVGPCNAPGSGGAGGSSFWSSARSFNSSRRNSNIGNGSAAAAAVAAAGLDAQMAQFGSAAAAAAAAGASQMDAGWFGGYNAATAAAAAGSGNDCKTLWNNQYNFMYASMGNDQVMKNANVEYVALPDGSFQTDLRVPSRIVGGIIGKNGARINDIRQKSRANIAIDRSRSPNRVITVKGSMNEVQAACALICKSIEENQ